MPPRPAEGSKPNEGWFSTTQWTVVLNARDAHTGNEALNQLCQTYWFPLYAYARRRGNNPEESADLTQDFFCRLLEKRFLDEIDPAKGRFRSFLLVAMKRHMANAWEKQTAQKRGGNRTVLSLDVDDSESRYQLEPADNVTPESLYERHWALLLLERVVGQLQAEFAEAGKSEMFHLLKPFLTGDAERADYGPIAAQSGSAETAVRMSVSRMRKRYRELLRKEVANTVGSEAKINDELEHLRNILRGQ